MHVVVLNTFFNLQCIYGTSNALVECSNALVESDIIGYLNKVKMKKFV